MVITIENGRKIWISSRIRKIYGSTEVLRQHVLMLKNVYKSTQIRTAFGSPQCAAAFRTKSGKSSSSQRRSVCFVEVLNQWRRRSTGWWTRNAGCPWRKWVPCACLCRPSRVSAPLVQVYAYCRPASCSCRASNTAVACFCKYSGQLYCIWPGRASWPGLRQSRVWLTVQSSNKRDGRVCWWFSDQPTAAECKRSLPGSNRAFGIAFERPSSILAHAARPEDGPCGCHKFPVRAV